MYSLALDIGAEPMLLLLQLRLERLVGSPDGLDLEQALHLLQRDTAGLGDEEEGVKEGEEGERRKEEVDAVAPGLEHLLGEAGHEEVEQPVAAGGCCLCKRTEVGIEEFLLAVVSAKFNNSTKVLSELGGLTELMTHGVPFHVGV